MSADLQKLLSDIQLYFGDSPDNCCDAYEAELWTRIADYSASLLSNVGQAAEPARAVADAKDAARYRWLKANRNSVSAFTLEERRESDEWDDKIDSLIAVHPQGAADGENTK